MNLSFVNDAVNCVSQRVLRAAEFTAAAVAAGVALIVASTAFGVTMRPVDEPSVFVPPNAGVAEVDGASSLPVPGFLTDVGMDVLGLFNVQVSMPVSPQIAVGMSAMVIHTQLWGTRYSGQGAGVLVELASRPAPDDPYILKAALTIDQLAGDNSTNAAHTSMHFWVADLLAGRRWTYSNGLVLSLAAGARFVNFRHAEFTYAVHGEEDFKLRFPVRRALVPAIELCFGRGPG